MRNRQGSPLYHIIKEDILKKIQEKIYSFGSKLPSEASLCKEYNVSRTTIRLALQLLEEEGLIEKKQGKGSFVKQPKIKETQTSRIKSFSEQMEEIGLEYYSKVLTNELVFANLNISNVLEIEPNELVVKIERLRYAKGYPYQYAVSYVPSKLAKGLEKEDCSGSLFELLKNKYKVELFKSVEAIEPINPSNKTARLLEISTDTASFLSESITYTTDMVPIEYSETVVRGDFAKFISERFYTKYI